MNIGWDVVIGVIVGISSIISASALGVRWLVKHYFDEIKHELKPNSGASLKDQVTRLERDIINLTNQNIDGDNYHQRLDSKIDHLTEVFIDYVSRQK
jgi:hypothetical protein